MWDLITYWATLTFLVALIFSWTLHVIPAVLDLIIWDVTSGDHDDVFRKFLFNKIYKPYNIRERSYCSDYQYRFTSTWQGKLTKYLMVAGFCITVFFSLIVAKDPVANAEDLVKLVTGITEHIHGFIGSLVILSLAFFLLRSTLKKIYQVGKAVNNLTNKEK